VRHQGESGAVQVAANCETIASSSADPEEESRSQDSIGRPVLYYLDFHRDVYTVSLPFSRKVIQALKAKHTSAPVFHQYDVIRNLLAGVFLVGIIEPDSQGVAGAVIAHPYLSIAPGPSLFLL
jgi:hypothetical protein